MFRGTCVRTRDGTAAPSVGSYSSAVLRRTVGFNERPSPELGVAETTTVTAKNNDDDDDGDEPTQPPQEKERPKDLNAQLGETLHSSMVRAVVEEGLAHHTPETLHELVRTGVYKESDVEVRLERQEKKVTCRSTPQHTTHAMRTNCGSSLAASRPHGAYFTCFICFFFFSLGLFFPVLLLWVLQKACGIARKGSVCRTWMSWKC